MRTVAVVICCKNEEALIGRCLESIKNADEIIVLDSGSQDGTLDIVRKYTDKIVMDYIWNDDFSSMQNHASSFATSDWILSIDSDEYLDCSFDEVRKAVELAKDYVACNMIAEGGQRLNFQFSRLFRNCPEIYWVQRIHKHLNIGGAGEQVGNVRIVFGWSPAHANDPDRALRILERVVSEEVEPGRNLYYLGREYWYKQRYKEAVDTLWKYVLISQWDAEKAESFFVMSQSYSALGDDDEARNACLQAIKINPNFKEAIEWMAGINPAEKSIQWKRMARTANNKDVLWDRVPAKPIHDIIFLAPHCDDESLFGSFTLMRYKPFVIICTESFLQYERGDINCDAETRRKETIEAMKLVGCPVVFLGIKDTELTEEILKDRLQYFNPETIYIPAIHENGNEQHNLVGKVALELFGHKNCERYCTYVKGDFNIVKGGWEIVPTQPEIELKNKMLDCYQSQINLPATAPHFQAVRNVSEWLI